MLLLRGYKKCTHQIGKPEYYYDKFLVFGYFMMELICVELKFEFFKEKDDLVENITILYQCSSFYKQ